ncbi:MAG TPA: hypothetical protein VKV40_12380 [Ktedonobacteraceae bacterium]|nr:hypothetical protein [Ktedonobacteraceae bacterium]
MEPPLTEMVWPVTHEASSLPAVLTHERNHSAVYERGHRSMQNSI